MDLLLVALLVLAVAAVVAVALGRVGGGMSPVDDSLPPPLPQPLARPADLDRARFGLALRGYRMDQVDLVLDEARDLLAAKDQEIARLRRLGRPEPLPERPSDDVPAPVPAPVDHDGGEPPPRTRTAQTRSRPDAPAGAAPRPPRRPVDGRALRP